MNRRELLLGGAAALGGVPLSNALLDKHQPKSGEVVVWLACNGGPDGNYGPTPETQNVQDGLELHGFEICERVTEIGELTKILSRKVYPSKSEAEATERHILTGDGGQHGMAQKFHVQAVWIQLR